MANIWGFIEFWEIACWLDTEQTAEMWYLLKVEVRERQIGSEKVFTGLTGQLRPTIDNVGENKVLGQLADW